MEKLVPRIEKSLTTQKKPIPDTLKLLILESETSKHNTIALAMHCFWTGEMKLGAIEGVVTTEAGWYENREVTLVTYHKDKINLQSLLAQAAKVKCANKVYLKTAAEIKLAKSEAKLSAAQLNLKDYQTAEAPDQKKQLSETKYANLKLSPAQATKMNAFVQSAPEKAKKLLTQRQLKEWESK